MILKCNKSGKYIRNTIREGPQPKGPPKLQERPFEKAPKSKE